MSYMQRLHMQIPDEQKRQSSCHFFGSVHVKAVRKMLMKMTPSDAIIDWSFLLLKFLRPSEKWAILEIFGLTCKKYYKINS